MITPFEVDELSDDWLTVFRDINEKPKRYQAVNQKVNEIRREWEKSHPYYKR